MLVFQGLLGALAIGEAHATPMLDAFGNPLCITSSESSPESKPHTGLPDCCTVSCSMFAVAGASDRATNSLFNPLPEATAALFTLVAVHIAPLVLARGPGNPRAPPYHL